MLMTVLKGDLAIRQSKALIRLFKQLVKQSTPLPKFLAAYEAVARNGHVKLQIVAGLG